MRRNLIIISSIIAVVVIATVSVLLFVPIQSVTQSTSTPTPTTVETTTQPNESQLPVIEYEVRKITIDNVVLDVEIADDNEKRELGLMYREELPEDRGMLFIFEQERKYQFWMMNMRINIDMIWIDAKGKVVHIVDDAKPCIDAAHSSQCTFNPDEPAKYVLEVYSGFVKKHGINENSVMHILT
jgi:hypothetical protein